MKVIVDENNGGENQFGNSDPVSLDGVRSDFQQKHWVNSNLSVDQSEGPDEPPDRFDSIFQRPTSVLGVLGEEGKISIPYWLSHAVCGAITFIAIVITIHYGLEFSQKKTEEWIIAMLVSILLSVFLVEAVKVVSIAYFNARFHPELLDATPDVTKDLHVAMGGGLGDLMVNNKNQQHQEQKQQPQGRPKLSFSFPTERDLEG